MATLPSPPPAEPLHRLPELLARLPLPSEVWARTEPRLPEPVRDLLALRHRLPSLPHPSARQLFAAAVPVGLMLGWLASFAVNPEIEQRGGKPYAEVAADGVDVQLPRLAYEAEGFPEDPAPFGYGPRAEYLNAGLADAGAYAEQAAPDSAAAVQDGEVLGEEAADAPAQEPRFTSQPVIEVVPQDTPAT